VFDVVTDQIDFQEANYISCSLKWFYVWWTI